MAASPIPGLPAVVSIAPRLEPHLVEVVVWYPFGAADEAVAAAAAKVEELLAEPNLGAALVETPGFDDDSPRAASTAFAQELIRALRDELKAYAVAQAEELAAAAVNDLITTPGKLRGLLPIELPSAPGVPWLNNGVLAFTPDT